MLDDILSSPSVIPLDQTKFKKISLTPFKRYSFVGTPDYLGFYLKKKY